MAEPDRNPNADDPLECALASALNAYETGGQEALDRVLAAHANDADRLREALAELSHSQLLQTPCDAAPKQLGDFRIGSQLGAGGMGVVYLAEQVSLGREVALKVVRPELLFFDGARERFRREIEAVAKLEHPAIVPILATGSVDGIPYYAMPRIRGRNAESVVKTLAHRARAELTGADLASAVNDPGMLGAVDAIFSGSWWQAAVQLVRKAALGIHHAHSRGILHRDLKPSNLMLTADGRAIVLDFGLAHASGDATLTRPGSAAGSPAYMAPEQVRGEPADARTDVYGLAATLHSLLALRPPFVVDDAESLRAHILAGTRHELPAGSALPAELRLVLATAMDVDRERRYATANAFAEDLQAVLDGRPIHARGLPLRVRAQRFAARHRVLATGLGALLAFVVVLPTVLLWQQHAANNRLAVQVRRSDQSVAVSLDAVEKLLSVVARDRMMHLPAAQEVAAEMLRGAVDLFDQLATDANQAERSNALRIRTLLRLADVETARGRLDEALAAARRAVALCGEDVLPPPLRLRRGDARRMLAGLLLDTDRTDEAEVEVKASKDDLQSLVAEAGLGPKVQGNLANLHSHAAVIADRRGDFVAEERALRAAIGAWERSQDQLGLARAQTVLSQFLKLQDRFDEAMPFAEAAITIATAADVPQHGWPVPLHVEAAARAEKASILLKMGREIEAGAAYQLAQQTFDQFLTVYPDEPNARSGHGAVANDLALIAVRHQQWQVARSLLETACSDQLAVLARMPAHAQALQFLGNHRRTLAVCLFHLGDLATLEPLARTLGQMAGSPLLTLGAARGLLRCAEAAAPERAAKLRSEAVDLMVETHRRGRAINADLDDALLGSVRDDPRLRAIAVSKPGR